MKQALVIRGDFYHPADKIDPLIDQLFTSDTWSVTRTDRARDVFEQPYDVVLFFTNGRPVGESDLTNTEQARIVKMVEAGMGIMFIHAGLVLIEADSPFYQQLHSGRFVGHSKKHVQLRTTPIVNVQHPIIKGLKGFVAVDEHYFVTVDTTKVDALMLSTSEEATSLGAWCSQVGEGHVFSLIPGHTFDALETPELRRIIDHALLWETGVAGNGSRN